MGNGVKGYCWRTGKRLRKFWFIQRAVYITRQFCGGERRLKFIKSPDNLFLCDEINFLRRNVTDEVWSLQVLMKCLRYTLEFWVPKCSVLTKYFLNEGINPVRNENYVIPRQLTAISLVSYNSDVYSPKIHTATIKRIYNAPMGQTKGGKIFALR